MKKLLFLLAFALYPLAACAQTPGAQPEFCVTSPSQTANYNQLCISASSSGGSLALTSFGSASGTLSITENGLVLGGRIKLTGPLTLYSDTSAGTNNSTCGLATGVSACNTLQYLFATRFVPNYDCAGQTVTLSFANNDTTGLNIQTAWTGGCQVTIQGPGGSPPSIGINTVGSAIQAFAPLPAPLNLTGFKVTSTNGPAIVIFAPGTINISNGMNIGATAGTQLQASGPGALINCTGGFGYTISGGGYAHWLAVNLGQISCGAVPITLTGTPAFTFFAQAIGLGEIFVSGAAFSGSATGARYNASANGAILTNTGGNPTFFPGNSAGSVATGGQYL